LLSDYVTLVYQQIVYISQAKDDPPVVSDSAFAPQFQLKQALWF
jgi:hypothetical protein